MNSTSPSDDAPLTFEAVHEEELKTLGRDGTTMANDPLSALCLSGGGIRSASFCLGVLQGLARLKLLGRFHYLSTVSGGGYIGSWLSAWRAAAAGSDQVVFDELNAATETGVEAPEIQRIRYNSNYLTPKLGLFSADTWTVIALYVRNLVLNWILFIPLFVSTFLLPHLCVAIVAWLKAQGEGTGSLLLAGGGMLLVVALSVAMYGRARRQDGWLTQRRFLLLVLLPIVFSAGCLASAGALRAGPREHVGVWGAGCGAVIYLIAWIFGSQPLWSADVKKLVQPASLSSLVRDLVGWSVAGAAVGALIAVGLTVGVSRSDPVCPFVVLGLSWVVLAYLVGELIYVGITSFSKRGDMDREWLARSSGWLSAVACSWALFTAMSLYVPHLILGVRAWVLSAIATAGGVSGVLTLVMGSSAKSAATNAEHLFSKVKVSQWVSLAACVFALCLAVGFSFAARALLPFVPHDATPLVALGWLAGGVLVLSLLSVGLSLCINVNRFSVHAIYRNRLVRAFLGAARARAKTPRTPDPFTGFDLADNVAMTLVKPAASPARLLHVVNMALNTVATDNLAWQERKASSFTVTPLTCGGKEVGYRPTSEYGHPGHGLSLGTAMAISGAAASPNMGYNSSPLVGFLLMLFNVRLGWWLGNPRCGKGVYTREGPFVGIKLALAELAGATTDKGHWIYLSDGGHFENLGVYEMVRRRCEFILVCDAGCDETAGFEDLGNALRKSAIDFGVTITFEPPVAIQRRERPPRTGPRCALGTIDYPPPPGAPAGAPRMQGWIVYLKPTFHGTEPMSVRSYAEAHPGFPHESTADQWFSESQLESYRALGEFTVQQVLAGFKAGQGVTAMRVAIGDYLKAVGGGMPVTSAAASSPTPTPTPTET